MLFMALHILCIQDLVLQVKVFLAERHSPTFSHIAVACFFCNDATLELVKFVPRAAMLLLA